MSTPEPTWEAGSAARSPAQRWQDDLNDWAIPQHILDQAPANPWVHPPAMFKVEPGKEFELTPSTRVALEALGVGGSVLDVGCGGGASSMPLTSLATSFAGVDEQAAMLTNFSEAAQRAGKPVTTYEGKWPAVADEVASADVVVCHHVVYNVGDIAPFVRALTNHARRRVVVELPATHPTAPFNPLWKHFWDLDRPEHPTAHDFIDVLRELGIAANFESFERPPRKPNLDSTDYISFVRQRLCLPESRDPEIVEAVAAMGPLTANEVCTVWWDMVVR